MARRSRSGRSGLAPWGRARNSDSSRPANAQQPSRINGQTTPAKGLTHRLVPMTKRLQSALLAIEGGASDKVLTPPGSTVPTARSLRRTFAKIQTRAGLEATGGLHLLRHSFCARLAMRGASPYTIQRLAGHQDFKTTTRYLGLTDSEARRAIGLLQESTDEG